MLALSRPMRQGLATLALLACTVAPTGYVASTAWRIARPGHLHDVEVEIGRQLDLHVAIEGVRYPRPGEVAYRGVVLRLDEPRRGGLTEVARASVVRLRREDRWLTLETEGLRLRGDGPKQMMAQINALLRRADAAKFDRVSLSAAACEVALGEGRLNYQIKDVAGTFQSDSSAPSLTISYAMADDGPSTRCELAVTRDRQLDKLRTTLAFKTMDGPPLPARVLEPFFESADWLGPQAKVWGGLTLQQSGSADWEADFRGDLVDVDLGTLVGQRFPGQRLGGLARIAISSARWADRPGQGFGWSEAEGEIRTGQGSIGIDLLKSLAAEMRFRVSPKVAQLDGRRPELDFQTLGLTFALAPDGEIRFGGGLGGGYAPGAVLIVANQVTPIVHAPQGAANVRGLIKTLFPGGTADAMVPATAESQVLQRRLPLPPGLAERATQRLRGQ